jgi:hypothetical protein
MTATLRLLTRCLGGVTAVVALSSCSMAAGSSVTDQEAEAMVHRISYPRQQSADGLVRAAVGTSAGTNSGSSVVVRAEDLHAGKLGDPIARLVFRFHHDGSQSGFNSTDPITACYEAEFSFYGRFAGPSRVTCPQGATEIVPTPIPPKPKAVTPAGFDTTLEKILTSLPATPTATDVRTRVTRALPAPALDPGTGLRNLQPTVDTAVIGSDVGVSLRASSAGDCLLGARVDGQATSWQPTRDQMQPGELTCDPQTALQRQGTKAPH